MVPAALRILENHQFLKILQAIPYDFVILEPLLSMVFRVFVPSSCVFEVQKEVAQLIFSECLVPMRVSEKPSKNTKINVFDRLFLVFGLVSQYFPSKSSVSQYFSSAARLSISVFCLSKSSVSQYLVCAKAQYLSILSLQKLSISVFK